MSSWSLEGEYGRKVLPPIHPGEILNEEFLVPMNISHQHIAEAIGVDITLIGGIVKGEESLSAETALLLSRFFGTSAELWVGLQTQYDLELAEDRLGDKLDAVRVYSAE